MPLPFEYGYDLIMFTLGLILENLFFQIYEKFDRKSKIQNYRASKLL